MSKQLIRSLAIAATFAGGYFVTDQVVEPTVAQAASATVTIDGYQYSKEVAEAFNYLNDTRKAMGLHPYKLDAKLSKSVQSHVNYLNSHKLTGHAETQGKSGFTGVDYLSRAKAAGYTNISSDIGFEGLTAGVTSAKEFINTQLISPNHRQGIMAANSDTIGLGFNGTYWGLVTNDSNYSDETQNKLIAYPYNGQTNAPTKFDLKENPNPLSPYKVASSGTIVSALPSQLYLISRGVTVVLKDDNGNVVPTFNTETELFGLGGYGVIPKQELKANSKYTGYITFTSRETRELVTESWSFTTGVSSNGVKPAQSGGTGGTTVAPTRTPTKPDYSAYTKRFADFDANAWWRDDMIWAIDRGLISGYSNVWNAKTKKYETQLQPNTQLTEYHFLTIFFRYAAKDELAKVKNSSTWSKSGTYDLAKKYKMPVLASSASAYSKGLADKGIRRGKLAQLMASHYYGKTVSENEAIQFFMDNGITTASSISAYNADNILTRSQISAFIQRYEVFISTKK